MKTKYILHGGSAQHIDDRNDTFFKEVLNSTDPKVNILLVHFASNPDTEKANYEKDTSQFLRSAGSKNLNFIVASRANFLDEIKASDIVYFGGGTTLKLLESLKEYKDLETSLKGKIVAGESAGANIFTKYCFSKSGGILRCLGVIPVKMIPHFEKIGSDMFLGKYPEVESLFLNSYEYKVYYV